MATRLRPLWPKRFRRRLREKETRSLGGVTVSAILLALLFVFWPQSGLGVRVGKYFGAYWWLILIVFAAFFIALLIESLWRQAHVPIFSRSVHIAISNPAASSIEFRQMFLELIGTAGLQSGNRVLVVVLDDLDRVGMRERRQALAVMRTFLDLRQSANIGRVWTIIPQRSTTGNAATGIGAEDDDPLEKLCQIRFVVPPPLVADWRQYLADKLKGQLPCWTEGDRTLAVAVYSERLANASLGRTPRRIGAFVNQLVSIAALREHSQQVGTEAIIRLAANALATGSDADPKHLIASNPAAGSDQGDIAALWINRERQQALQAVYEDDVTQCLRGGDSAALNGLAANCPQIAEVALTIVEQGYPGWVANEPHILGNCAVAVEGLEGPEALQIRARLAKAVANVKEWKSVDERSGRGFGLLCTAVPAMADAIFTNLAGVANRPMAPADGENVTRSIHALVEAGSQLLPTPLRIGTTPLYYLDFLSRLHEVVPRADLGRYAPACQMAEVHRMLADGQRDEVWLGRLTAANPAGIDVSWITSEAEQLPQNPGDNSLSMALRIAAMVMVVGKVPTAVNLLKKLRADGRIFALLASTQDGSRAMTALILCVLLTKPNLETYGTNNPRANGCLKAGAQLNEARTEESPAWARLVQCTRDAGARSALQHSIDETNSGFRPLLERLLASVSEAPKETDTAARA